MSALKNSCDLIDFGDDEVFTANIDLISFRSSHDNNPFDKAEQGLAENFNDPFEIVEENIINLNRRRSNNDSNVRTENLISIHDNNADEKNTQQVTDGKSDISTNTTNYHSVSRDIRYSTADSTTSISPIQSLTLSENTVTDYYYSSNTFNKGICADSTGLSSDTSSVNSSQLNRGLILDSLASLQISPNDKSPNDIKGSNLKRLSTTDCNISSVEKRLNSKRGHNKLRTSSLDINSPRGLNCMRNQLLKLSLSNSSLNSPAKRTDKDFNDKSADSSIYSEARTVAESILNVGETDSSPNDSCDDLMSIKPNWIDSENELDNDLEQLNIPFLQEIAKSEFKDNQDHLNRTVISEQLLKDIKHHKDTYQVGKQQKPATEINNSIEKTDEDKVEKLIDNLKNCLESYDEEKKDRANSLLQTLSFVLNKNEVMPSTPSGLSIHAPTPITRQGTFDLDIHNTAADIIENTPSIGIYNKTDAKMHGGNVYDDNIGTSNNLGTNIVVMSTPIPMAKEKSNKEVNFREPVLIEMRTKRSQSVSLHDKPNIVAARYRQNTYSESPSVYGTPIRPRITSRRYSVSGTPPPLPSTNARRSIYGIQNNDVSKTNVSQRRSLALPPPIKITVGHKNNPTIKLDTIGKTLKVKNNDLMKKPKGPLKATIPIKKVAPMIVTPSISSPIEGEEKHKTKTSTPLLNVKGRPSACSTPVQNNRVLVSPIQNATIKPKPRQSYLSVTPNGKPQSTSASFHNRRRTKSASKSPKKSLDATNDKANLEIRTMKLPQESLKMSASLRKSSSLNSTVNRKSRTGLTNEKNKENNIPK